MYFLLLSLSSVILTDSSTESPVHVSIQAMRGLPRLHALGIVPHTISFSKQLPVSSWWEHSMLASLLWRCLTVPSLLQLLSRTQSLVFLAVHETHRIFFSPFISKASRRVSLFFSECPAFTAVRCYIFAEIGMLCNCKCAEWWLCFVREQSWGVSCI